MTTPNVQIVDDYAEPYLKMKSRLREYDEAMKRRDWYAAEAISAAICIEAAILFGIAQQHRMVHTNTARGDLYSIDDDKSTS